MVSKDLVVKDSLVLCQNGQGEEFRAGLLRLTRHVATFEIYAPTCPLRTSEALTNLKVIIQQRLIYSGRAVVSNLVHAGTMLVCEVTLEERGFCVAAFADWSDRSRATRGYLAFLEEWQRVYQVRPEFKIVVADMQTFLADLRLWLEQVELEIRSHPAANRAELERQAAQDLGEQIVPAFNAMHERLESLADAIDPDLRPAHQHFAKRQLHPLMLCSPFAYRTYHKPLGYAGDYEMVNMIMRDPYEGASLFAKLVNLWFLSQWPARAHRNRIAFLKRLLDAECLRAARRGQPLRVLNLGCGPAREIQEFMAESPLADRAQFTLLDFNDETIQYAGRVLEEIKRRHGRQTQIHLQRKSVHQILKEGTHSGTAANGQYDCIYCAGLFDYLSDRTCRQLVNIFYQRLAPGALLAITNVDATKPFRHMLEFVLEWHLIYRDATALRALASEVAPRDALWVEKDSTGVNAFLQIRKPGHE